jgi:hypothetical protein
VEYESEINKAVQSLRNQGISVNGPIVGSSGHVFDVMGFMLTEAQIVTLQRENRLGPHDIREFAKKIEG